MLGTFENIALLIWAAVIGLPILSMLFAWSWRSERKNLSAQSTRLHLAVILLASGGWLVALSIVTMQLTLSYVGLAFIALSLLTLMTAVVFGRRKRHLIEV